MASTSIKSKGRVVQHHPGIVKKELGQKNHFLWFLVKWCFGEWALAPPGWALHRDAGIQEGGHSPLQAQAVARGNLMFLQAA